MTVKVFGQLCDVFEKDNISIADATDIDDLKNHLHKLYPTLGDKEFAIAVNKQIIHENISLQPDAEIALLPPFSGG